jgi:hypothetical protein
MSLIETSKAIYCQDNCGPVFGGGHDIRIYNCANINKNSYCNFPTSYNSKDKYKCNQESCNIFCGTPSGYFSIQEYEVFELVFN